MSTQIQPNNIHTSTPILHRKFCVIKMLVLCGMMSLPTTAHAAENTDKDSEEQLRRSTAVALNYCRASFHRIQKYPTPQVLMEERDNILSNLNLNEIDDQEIIKLYSGVLQEINGMELAKRERSILKDKHAQAFNQKMWGRSLEIAANFATANMAGMVQSGAAGWWDYRTFDWQRNVDLWKLDKERMTGIYDKSSNFLDTFWKLTRKRNIPDRWLIRSTDLDSLEMAMKEKRPDVRLRILKRMERYMEYYPPYSYYVARTEQELGQLFAASQTYAKLNMLSEGHFRKDEMLAAGLANKALIQAYLKQPSAIATAQSALEKSTDVWQVNLICARILTEHQQFNAAEESLLRNLDIGLEERQSRVGLLTLFYRSGNQQKMLAQLKDPRVLASVPAPVLLQCSSLLAAGQFPQQLKHQLTKSIRVEPRLGFGADDIVVLATPEWNFEKSQVALQIGQQQWNDPYITRKKTHVELRFPGIVEWGSPLQGQSVNQAVALSLRYRNSPNFKLTMIPNSNQLPQNGRRYSVGGDKNPTSALTLAAVEMNQMKLSFNSPMLSWQGGQPHRIRRSNRKNYDSLSADQKYETAKPAPAVAIPTPAGANPFDMPPSRTEKTPFETSPFDETVVPNSEPELPTVPVSRPQEQKRKIPKGTFTPVPSKGSKQFRPKAPVTLKGIISAELPAE